MHQLLTIFFLSFCLTTFSQSLIEIDPKYANHAEVRKDGSIWLMADMKKDHRIFGYSDKSTQSTKMILLSIFTDEVENNPFDCKYGAYYETNEMKNMSLLYLASDKKFLKVGVQLDEEMIDVVFMEKKFFVFED